MKPELFLAKLRGRGAVVEARSERLHIDAPEDVLRPQVLEAARRLKPALLEILLLEAATSLEVEPTLEPHAQVLAAQEEAAVRLAHQLGRTAGGWPLEVDAGSLYRSHNPLEGEPQVLAASGGGS